MSGLVVGLYIAPDKGAPMRTLVEVRAVPGRGLEGDRYFLGAGTFTGDQRRDSEVTLMALEDLLAMEEETGVKLSPGDVRRNVVTEGAELQALVGREFRLGTVRLHATRISEPCRHLATLTDGRILKGLAHRSGLQAQILTEGVIRLGDAVVVG
jgi:MOSC domain-containing protein YiiM